MVNGETVAAWLPVRRGPDGETAGEFGQSTDVIMRTREVDGKPRTELLVVYEPGYRITGDMLESAHEGLDSLGSPCIQFALNAEGAANMKSLTTALKPQGERTHKLAIIFDGEVYSAPRVMSPIGERGEITGQFTRNEVRQTVHVLRSGELPCQLTFEKMIVPPAK